MTTIARATRRREQRGVRKAVDELLRRGFDPVPIYPRSKQPSAGDDWPVVVITPENVDQYFDDDSNVGLKLGNGVADVDMDVLEAILAGDVLLPPTDMRHGRASARRAHKWYRVRGTLRSLKLVDPIDGKTIIELRADSAAGKKPKQTLVPPSLHDDTGELLEWESFGEPAVVNGSELIRAVHLTATAALIARRRGAAERHGLGLALAGFCLRGGLSAEETKRLMRGFAAAAGCPGRDDFERGVDDTAAAIASGRPATGGPKLVEMLPDGQRIVTCIAKWLNFSSRDPAAVDDVNVTPLDIFGDTALVGSPVLSPHALPSVIATYAWDEAERLGVDPAMIAIPCIVVAAAAIHDAFVVQPKAQDTVWKESARLWAGVVCEPGEKKTPSLRKATVAIYDAECRWHEEDEAAMAAYRLAEHVYRKALQRYKGAGTPQVAPVKPPQRRLLVDDTTIEALRDTLVDNPRGVLVFSDELTGWFGSFDAYRSQSGRDRALWIETFNGGPKPVDRVKGRILVRNWSTCILGGIQPGAMQRLASKIDDDGLLQRFIVVFPGEETAEVDRPPNYSAIAAYRQLICQLVDLVPRKERVVFTFAPEAQAERRAVARVAKNVMQLPETSRAFKGHLGKLEGIFARLALTFHIVESVATGIAAPAVISAETAARAARLLVDYLLPNAARFYLELVGQQEHLVHARWIAGYILAHATTRISERDIGRVYRPLRGQRRATINAMTALVAVGWVFELESSRPGGPTRWRVNPLVHQAFAARAAEERARRERIVQRVAEAVRELGGGAEGEVSPRRARRGAAA